MLIYVTMSITISDILKLHASNHSTKNLQEEILGGDANLVVHCSIISGRAFLKLTLDF